MGGTCLACWTVSALLIFDTFPCLFDTFLSLSLSQYG
jgi:hypothetical protein